MTMVGSDSDSSIVMDLTFVDIFDFKGDALDGTFRVFAVVKLVSLDLCVSAAS